MLFSLTKYFSVALAQMDADSIEFLPYRNIVFNVSKSYLKCIVNEQHAIDILILNEHFIIIKF